MPAIVEIEVSNGDENRSSVAHFSVDGKEYIILVGARTKSVSVVVGRWIKDRRSIGKTFWKRSDLINHYKKHGQIIAEYADKFKAFGGNNA